MNSAGFLGGDKAFPYLLSTCFASSPSVTAEVKSADAAETFGPRHTKTSVIDEHLPKGPYSYVLLTFIQPKMKQNPASARTILCTYHIFAANGTKLLCKVQRARDWFCSFFMLS